ncbi:MULTISPECIES: phage major capsid protein [unclassified Granulicatella]|uniref:phage major capsid protein n=1 Tax=unclassified Granulicatella TaxID=2630493 RepID=UPI001073A181|nr:MULTISPECIES: phage major capsid protein [unclassified Granulicatella]MBF0780508.1 phage major capsid protein [Granulicatella sp. 19428wC4_WM01]TFU95323.1 phage major capsid protein [Granulicatella sp. WM01]
MNEKELRALLTESLSDYEKASESNAPIEELREKAEKVKELRGKLDLAIEMKHIIPEKTEDVVETDEKRSISDLLDDDIEKEYTATFLRALRKPQSLTERDEQIFERMKHIRAQDVPTATPYFQSSVEDNGGLIVPKDVETRIHEYKRQMEFDLSTLVTTEIVSSPTGVRVFEKLADMVPFAEISEWDKIEDIPSPQFEKKEYSLKDYAGILPIPRKLIQDTDQNLLSHVAKWIAKKTLLTRNTVILNVLATFNKRQKAIGVTDDLKDILNVELDGAFSTTAVIVTNQDGWNWLDKCKDENGNYLIQKDVTGKTPYTIFARHVVVVPNRTLKSNGKKAPVYIGDLKEALILFDRNVYEVTGTEIGGKSFERNSFDIRVIDRFNVEKWDEGAVIVSEIDTSKAPTLPSTTSKSGGGA